MQSPYIIVNMPVELAYKLRCKPSIRFPDISDCRVSRAAEGYATGAAVPPIRVRNLCTCGEPGHTGPEVNDGMHRLAAAMHLGIKTIPARVPRGLAAQLGLNG